MYEYSAKILRLVDGDTCDAQIELGFKIGMAERFRLLGVNTPETYSVKRASDEYRAGIAATISVFRMLAPHRNNYSDTDVEDFLKSRHPDLGSNGVFYIPIQVRIRTHKDAKGKYGRYLAEVFVGDDTESINTKLIRMGFGAEY